MAGSRIRLSSFTIDCARHGALARFYAELMNWVVVYEGEEYAVIAPPDTARGAYITLTFQKNEDFTSPVWPEKPGAQQQMAHIDFAVDDIAASAARAIALGARYADEQFSEDWSVMLDPEGHPFCLVGMGYMLDSPECALK